MSENLIPITYLNDFIFCPVSIYFHQIDREADRMVSQNTAQINGTNSHRAVDDASYSCKSSILQGISVYCEQFGLYGKIDVFDIDKGLLTERKKKITTIYDGYVFQLYAQYYSLVEMGYDVRFLRLYSMDDNKVFPVLMPSNDSIMKDKFEKLINNIKSFSFYDFHQNNEQKCRNCIYEPLCSFSCI